MIKEFNATVRYLESVLESEIDEREFLRISYQDIPFPCLVVSFRF